MPITQTQKNKNYHKAQKKNGFVQIHPWVPKANKKEFEQLAELRRTEHLKEKENG